MPTRLQERRSRRADLRLAAMLAGTVALAGCATVPTGPGPQRAARIPIPYASTGLERVIGQNAAGLTQLFGEPDADVREGTARRLQFSGPICVLDAYLYPKGPKDRAADPTVTYLDAREPDGSPIDRASCVAALTRRGAAR
ncbi:hypothetical protein [uncultured Sphingomonas sp.]|uniref:hypothetical protein n=1 Tax=uncultured Sphingomonas sp. TaxID=158754 RepID=UPI0035CB44C5